MEVDWDLHAVVRGSSSSSSHSQLPRQPLPSAPPPPGSHLPMDQQSPLLDWQLPYEPPRSSAFQELHDLYKPFFRKPLPVSLLSSSLSSSLFRRTKDEPSSSHTPSSVCQNPPRPPPASQSSKSKKRKKDALKKVCEVPADSLSSDVWAWRKYGQKPIKGSPFPRSYYRCSSSKGCLARKQVDRNRSDPGMFIVTYTGDHNHPGPTHRNSLAGVSRQKQHSPASTPTSEITYSDSNVEQATCCSSPEEKEESAGEQEMEEEWEMLTGDDFFAGLEGLMGWSGDGSGEKEEEEQGRWDPRQTCFSFPWTANNTAAAAAGGGS